MKNLIILLTMFWGISSFAQVNCPGSCVNIGGNPQYNQACRGAGVNGALACQKYSSLGCSWAQQRPVIVRAAQCVNASNNSMYDALCAGAGVNGAGGCQKYQNLGCAWYPAQYRCQ